MNSKRAKGFRNTTAKSIESSGKSPASGFFGAIAFYGLLLTILLFSIPYGTVEVWHKSLLVLFISVFAGFRMIDSAVRGSFEVVESRLLLPLIGILGLAILQIVPLPGDNSVISVDPYETKSFILIFGALIVAGEILICYTNSTHRLRVLIGLVITVGVGSAVFGILREFFLDTQSDLLSGYLNPDQGFAQFINRNHFAVLMEMSFGLLLGLLIKGDLSEKMRFVGWMLSGIMIYSMIASNSRGGLMSLAGLSVFTVFVHMIQRDDALTMNGERSRKTLVPGKMIVRRTLVAVCLCVLVFGLIMVTVAFVGGDTVVTRIEKLGGEVETVNNTRLNRNVIWSSTINLIKARPIFGSGFGGFAAAIPEFDASAGKSSLKQAHNDYLEILANGGIIGFALFTGFAALVIVRIFRNLKSKDPLFRSSCFGAAIGMFGVLIHNFVDFGLHTIINSMIFTVLVVIATAKFVGTAQKQTS